MMIRRRQFIVLLGSAAVAGPSSAQSQTAGPPIVGVLSPISSMAAARNVEALREGLRELGYIEGRNIAIELRFADGAVEPLPELAAGLVGLKPAVIVAGSPSAAIACHNATRTIPIVMNCSSDPIALGLATSMARPGGNVTGFWWGGEGLIGKRLELLKETVPGIQGVGVIINPDDATNREDLASLPATANALAIATRVIEVRSPEDFDAAFGLAEREGLQGLYVSTTPLFVSHRGELAARAESARLPAIYGFRDFAFAGGLMAYGASLADMYRRKAGLIDKILKGTNPADIPIERPTRFELLVNLKTAKALNLSVPPTLLARADEVIE